MLNYSVTTYLPPDLWSAFVYNHPNGNIFQTPEMYEVYKHTKIMNQFFGSYS